MDFPKHVMEWDIICILISPLSSILMGGVDQAKNWTWASDTQYRKITQKVSSKYNATILLSENGLWWMKFKIEFCQP